MIVKKNSIKIKMKKVKGQFSYENWMDLVPKDGMATPGKEEDPGAGLMRMMKQMYDDGDDNMRKSLGEAMLKSQQDRAMGRDPTKDLSGPGFDDMQM